MCVSTDIPPVSCTMSLFVGFVKLLILWKKTNPRTVYRYCCRRTTLFNSSICNIPHGLQEQTTEYPVDDVTEIAIVWILSELAKAIYRILSELAKAI